jgi:hypothetical protein
MGNTYLSTSFEKKNTLQTKRFKFFYFNLYVKSFLLSSESLQKVL